MFRDNEITILLLLIAATTKTLSQLILLAILQRATIDIISRIHHTTIISMIIVMHTYLHYSLRKYIEYAIKVWFAEPIANSNKLNKTPR